MKTTVIIPFRDRGKDPRRAQNLEVVTAWWYGHGYDVHVVNDGLSGDAQFNRHKAYNTAVELFPETDVFVFTEADMLIHPEQIRKAEALAFEIKGLVVPFTEYRYLSDHITKTVVRQRYHQFSPAATAEWWYLPPDHRHSVFSLHPESRMMGGKSIGAINVVSRKTLETTGGFTEATSGNWYDDNIIEEGFAFLTGVGTRWVDGPAAHLYHLPGWKGDHLTDEDKMATAANGRILAAMRGCIARGEHQDVRELMSVRACREQDGGGE